MIRKYTVSPPIVVDPIDTISIVNGILEHRRYGVLIASRNLREMESALLSGSELVGSKIESLFLEIGRMVITLISVVNPTPPATGPYRVNYSDGSQREYSNLEELQGEVDLVDTELLQRLLVARYVTMLPAANDPAIINGTSLEIDLSSALSPVVFAKV